MLPGSARPEAKFFHGFAAGSHSIDAVLRQGVALELGQLVLVVLALFVADVGVNRKSHKSDPLMEDSTVRFVGNFRRTLRCCQTAGGGIAEGSRRRSLGRGSCRKRIGPTTKATPGAARCWWDIRGRGTAASARGVRLAHVRPAWHESARSVRQTPVACRERPILAQASAPPLAGAGVTCTNGRRHSLNPCNHWSVRKYIVSYKLCSEFTLRRPLPWNFLNWHTLAVGPAVSSSSSSANPVGADDWWSRCPSSVGGDRCGGASLLCC